MEDFLTDESRHSPKDKIWPPSGLDQWLRRALPVFTEEPSSVPRTHTRQLTFAQGNPQGLASSGTCTVCVFFVVTELWHHLLILYDRSLDLAALDLEPPLSF